MDLGQRASTRRRIRSGGVLLAAACLVAISAACAGGATSRAHTVGDQLTFAVSFPPFTLNPAKTGNGGFMFFLNPAYDSLTYQAPDGSVNPELATSFGYVGADNRTFDLTLRTGVKFADGSSLTAQGVADYLNYFKGAGGVSAVYLKAVDSITALGPIKVEIKLSTPNPMLPLLFSQLWPMGAVVSPEALKDPKSLDTNTYGVGPYMLDISQTVAGDHYTYVPAPTYYDKSKVHYKKLVVKVVGDPNARLQAMRAGQVDVARGDSAHVDSATGLQIIHTLAFNEQLILMDLGGSVTKPLADVRVRQALNYSINRGPIAKAIGGRYGRPTVQPGVPGYDLYDPVLESKYAYDPAKAKQMLADAGYPNGFSLTLLSSALYDQTAQAIADNFGQIGVKVTIRRDPGTDYLSGKYSASMFHAGLNAYIFNSTYLVSNAPFNPFHYTDPTLTDLTNRYATADAKTQVTVARQIEARLVDQAWFVPVYDSEVFYYANKNVGGVEINGVVSFPNPVDFYPK